jgi:hypothetical protein
MPQGALLQRLRVGRAVRPHRHTYPLRQGLGGGGKGLPRSLYQTRAETNQMTFTVASDASQGVSYRSRSWTFGLPRPIARSARLSRYLAETMPRAHRSQVTMSKAARATSVTLAIVIMGCGLTWSPAAPREMRPRSAMLHGVRLGRRVRRSIAALSACNHPGSVSIPTRVFRPQLFVRE